jgi:hypothetical protein
MKPSVLWFCACLGVLALSCSDPAVDAGNSGTADAVSDVFEPLEIVGGDLTLLDQGEDPQDLTAVDAIDDEGGSKEPDVEPPAPGSFGAWCLTPNDCDSGLCVPSPKGLVCTVPCDSTCPDGFKCAAKTSPRGDVIWMCIPAHNQLCDPCDGNADCNEPSEFSNVCVSFGTEGSFCAVACGPGLPTCPGGYSCQATIDPATGKKAQQCLFDGPGLCPCSPKAMSLELETPCKNVNFAGECKGVRKCGGAGLTECQAPVPAAEECNGLDDDCNGKTDDLELSDPCWRKNPFGKCLGKLVSCVGGQAVCDAKEPMPEVCNGLDDDCDGTTDQNDLLCDDGNPCTKGTCNLDGSCKQWPQTGQVCDDGNSCTLTDKCSQGTCTGGQPMDCDDGDPCTADGCDALGGCVHTAGDGACADDGSPCTLDVCSAGKCTHPPKDEGGTCTDDGEACTQDVCQGGACVHPPTAEGGACMDDGNPCTTDVCQKGACVHPFATFAVACADDGNACTADVCDKGACSHQPLGSEKGCLEDGDPCTQDVCLTGKCSHPPAVNGSNCADDGIACTDDLCMAGKCTHPNLDGKTCVDDGLLCTQDVCSAGKCTHPGKEGIACEEDGNPCTNDKCQGGKCAHPYNNGGCTDNDPCTVTDYCNLGVCKGIGLLPCNDGNPCTNDKCASGVGCTSTPAVSLVCNDNNVCTNNDVCNNGVCKGSGGKDCDDGNSCTNDNCDSGGGCTHTANTGACASDSNPCTDDVCANSTCTHPPKTNGQACDKNTSDPCADGVCQSGTCKSQYNNNVCNDGNACTSNDKCVNGVCEGTAFKDCNDSNPCTQDSCDKTGQCLHQSLSGTACTAGSGECPIGVCQAGQCASKPGVTCQAEYDVDLCSSVSVPGTCSGSGKCVAGSIPPAYQCPGCNGLCIKCYFLSFCISL